MLNINELANALKPVVIPGEEMMVRVIQEGREMGQGVAFLDDGTMVVIEGGKKFINSHLDVSITRVLQTAAGRIIFAQPQRDLGCSRDTCFTAGRRPLHSACRNSMPPSFPPPYRGTGQAPSGNPGSVGYGLPFARE